MPRAYGADRLHQRQDGSVVLISPFSKEWIARKPRTNTSPQIPGTAVLWDGEYWEVVRAEPGLEGRVTYHLSPMRDDHTIRSIDGYSAEHEAARRAAHQKATVHQRQSAFAWIFAFALGLLPEPLQRKFDSEYGVPAERMTAISTIPFLLFGVFCASRLQIEGLSKPQHPLPKGVPGLGLLFFIEALVRLRSAMKGQPIGEMIVSLPYILFVAPFRAPRIPEDRKPKPPPPAIDIVVRDAYRIREPYLALLSPAEQRELQRVFSFDPISWGKKTAAVLLSSALFGLIISGFRLIQGTSVVTALLSIALALALAIEQVIRLRLVNRGVPAGSFLAPVVRPFLRKVLDPALFGPEPEDQGTDGDLSA
jgi:hypothetical protein